MTKEHIGIAAALGLPLVVVITKIDIAPAEVYKHTLDSVMKILRQARKMPFQARAWPPVCARGAEQPGGATPPPLAPPLLQVRVPSNVETAAAAILTDRITPIVCISNVTGEGLDLLRLLLSHLPGG